jgi:hypothetical protein
MKRFISAVLKVALFLVALSAVVIISVYAGYTAGNNSAIVWDDRSPGEEYLAVGEEYLISVIVEGGQEITMPDGETQMIYIGRDKDNHAIKIICTKACEGVKAGKMTEFRVTYARSDGMYAVFSAVGIRRKNIEINWQLPRDFGQGYDA